MSRNIVAGRRYIWRPGYNAVRRTCGYGNPLKFGDATFTPLEVGGIPSYWKNRQLTPHRQLDGSSASAVSVASENPDRSVSVGRLVSACSGALWEYGSIGCTAGV
jgi:hypothetical protein